MLFNPFDIFQPQLGLNNLHIADRVDVAFDVNDFGIVEDSDDLEDAVDRSNVRQESVACASRLYVL